MTQLLHKQLTGKIIGVYYDVYNKLSHNYPESIYEQAMMSGLRKNRVLCKHQKEYQIFYKNRLVGLQRLDIFVSANRRCDHALPSGNRNNEPNSTGKSSSMDEIPRHQARDYCEFSRFAHET